jgi:hypothetical protein
MTTPSRTSTLRATESRLLAGLLLVVVILILPL